MDYQVVQKEPFESVYNRIKACYYVFEKNFTLRELINMVKIIHCIQCCFKNEEDFINYQQWSKAKKELEL